jgi:hypothetical protein
MKREDEHQELAGKDTLFRLLQMRNKKSALIFISLGKGILSVEKVSVLCIDRTFSFLSFREWMHGPYNLVSSCSC